MSINLAWYARTEFLHEGALVEKIVFVEKHALLSLPACHRMCVLFIYFFVTVPLILPILLICTLLYKLTN